MMQQRSRLELLGVDIWVPRHLAVSKRQPAALRRDQITEDSHTQFIQPVKEVVPQQPFMQASVQEFDQVEPERVNVSIQPESVVPLVEIEREAVEEIAPFHLAALPLASCVLLLDASALTEQQQQLWLSLQRAFHLQASSLKWPFPLAQYQDVRGAPSYMQGFIDAQGLDKKLITLGNIHFLQQVNVQQLPSLQEMLDEPLNKRVLWQVISTP